METSPQFIQNLSAKDKAALRAKAIERIKSIKERNAGLSGGSESETNNKVQNGVD